jgi:hypothetical protein
VKAKSGIFEGKPGLFRQGNGNSCNRRRTAAAHARLYQSIQGGPVSDLQDLIPFCSRAGFAVNGRAVAQKIVPTDEDYASIDAERFVATGENTHQRFGHRYPGWRKARPRRISSWTARRDSTTPERRFETFCELSLQYDSGDSQKSRCR